VFVSEIERAFAVAFLKGLGVTIYKLAFCSYQVYKGKLGVVEKSQEIGIYIFMRYPQVRDSKPVDI